MQMTYRHISLTNTFVMVSPVSVHPIISFTIMLFAKNMMSSDTCIRMLLPNYAEDPCYDDYTN